MGKHRKHKRRRPAEVEVSPPTLHTIAIKGKGQIDAFERLVLAMPKCTLKDLRRHLALFFSEDPDLQMYQFSFVDSKENSSRPIELGREKDLTIEEVVKLSVNDSVALDVPRLFITANLAEQRQPQKKSGRQHVESKLRTWATKSKAMMRLLKPQAVEGMLLTPQVLLAALSGKSVAGGLGLTAEELHLVVDYMGRTAKQRATDTLTLPTAQRERVPETMEEIEAAVSDLRWWQGIPILSRLRLLPVLTADELAAEMGSNTQAVFKDGLRSRLLSQASLTSLPSMFSTGATLANKTAGGSYSGNGHQDGNQWMGTACAAWARQQFAAVRIALSRAEASYAEAGEGKTAAAARCLRDLVMAEESMTSVMPDSLAQGQYDHALRTMRSAGMALLRYTHHPKRAAAQMLLSVAQSQLDATQEVDPAEVNRVNQRYQRKNSYLPPQMDGSIAGGGSILQSLSAPALGGSPAKASPFSSTGTIASAIGGGGWSQQSLVAQQEREQELQAKVEIDEATAIARVGVHAAEKGFECFMLAKTACSSKRRQFAEAKAMLAQAQAAFGWLEQQDERTRSMVETMRRERRQQQSLPVQTIPTAKQLGALAWRVHEAQAHSVAETLRSTHRTACGGGNGASHNDVMAAEQEAATAVWGVYRWLKPAASSQSIEAPTAAPSISSAVTPVEDVYRTLPVMAMFTLTGVSAATGTNGTAVAAAAAAAADGAYGGKEHQLEMGPTRAQLREMLLPNPTSSKKKDKAATAILADDGTTALASPASSPEKGGAAGTRGVEILREALSWVVTHGGCKGVRIAVYALLELLTRLQLSQTNISNTGSNNAATATTEAPGGVTQQQRQEQRQQRQARRRAQRAERAGQRVVIQPPADQQQVEQRQVQQRQVQQQQQGAQGNDGMGEAEAVALALVRQGAVRASVAAVLALVKQGCKQKSMSEVQRDREMDRDRRQGRPVKERPRGREVGWVEEELCCWLRLLAFLVRCGGKKGATLAVQQGAVAAAVEARELYPLLEPPAGGVGAHSDAELGVFTGTRELSACVLQVMVALASSSGGERQAVFNAETAAGVVAEKRSKAGSGAAVVVVVQQLIDEQGLATVMALLGRHASSAPAIAVGSSWFVRQFLPPLLHQKRALEAEARQDILPGREKSVATGVIDKRLLASAEALLMKGAALPLMQAVRKHAAHALREVANTPEADGLAQAAAAAGETGAAASGKARAEVVAERENVSAVAAVAVEAAMRALLALVVAYPAAVASQVEASGLCDSVSAPSSAAAAAQPVQPVEGSTAEENTADETTVEGSTVEGNTAGEGDQTGQKGQQEGQQKGQQEGRQDQQEQKGQVEEGEAWGAALDLPGWEGARTALIELREALAPTPVPRRKGIEFSMYVHQIHQ
jgi:hypothetical protein